MDATTPPSPLTARLRAIRSRSTRLAAVGLLAALVSGCAGEGDPTVAPSASATSTPAPTTTVAPDPTGVASGVPTTDVDQVLSITYAGGEITGDTGRVKVALGSKVRIVVTSDVAEELHLHVYDRTVPVSPGAPAELVFTADVPGQIELELHDAGRVLVRLVIS